MTKLLYIAAILLWLGLSLSHWLPAMLRIVL